MKGHVFVSLCAVLIAGAAIAEDYPIGFTWNFSDDWVDRPASDQGTTNGNPGVDSVGNPVYSFERYVGVPSDANLDSDNPWYTYPTARLTWDDDWYGWGGVWSDGNNVYPMIHPTLEMQGSSLTEIPALRWKCPSNETLRVRLSMPSPYCTFLSFDDRVDLAIFLLDVSEDELHLLRSETMVPQEVSGSNWKASIPPFFLERDVKSGDSIVITCKKVRMPVSQNFNFVFEGAEITVLPEEEPDFLKIHTAVELEWFAASGTTYQVQYVTELSSTNWLDFGSPVIGNNTTNFVFDTTRGDTNKFYRVEEVE